MKRMLTTIFASLIATSAHAELFHVKPIVIPPGQCIYENGQRICAAPERPRHRRHHRDERPIIIDQRPVEITQYAFCSLTESQSPNKWVLYQAVTRDGQTTKTQLRSYPHFEQSKCEAEAERFNSK